MTLEPSTGPATPPGRVAGHLHGFLAFDVGEAIDLSRAKDLIRGDYFQLPRESRTPSSFRYRPLPLRVRLGPWTLPLLGKASMEPDVTVFDFAAVSLAFHIPFEASAEELTMLAESLNEPHEIVQAARAALAPLIERLSPAIERPQWSELVEEYFVFQWPPGAGLPGVESLLRDHSLWLAQLVRLDRSIPAACELEEALRLRISYSPSDLVIPDWGAAVVIDRDCEEILETIAFANVQLLELRHVDERLDGRLAEAYAMTHRLTRSWLPFWRSHSRTVRALGELRLEINESMERTTNALKLIGDQYLARVYQRLVTRFHLDDWTRSVEHSLDVLEGIYRVAADQSATLRAELLEITVVILILIEILASFRH